MNPQFPPQPGMQVPQSGGIPGVGAPPGAAVPIASPIKTNLNSTQNTLLISEIRDGIVIMNDGSYRAVVMCRSINFDLMSPQEREAVEYAFQGFLNSLYFPIQIFIHSSKIDIRPYIQKLDKIRGEHDNMLLAYLMEDYIGFIESVAQQTNIMDKKFYVVVPFFPTLSADNIKEVGKGILGSFFEKKQQTVVINEDDLEKAKAELRNRAQTIMAGLQQCGVQSLPLDTQELIELYYDVYNPDTATRQQLKNFDDLTAPVVTKGEGQAVNPNLNRELV
jgi:type IV secretory pathway VirB4 component